MPSQNRKHRVQRKNDHHLIRSIGKISFLGKIVDFLRIKSGCRKTNHSNDRNQRSTTNPYQSLGFSTPPTARRQHLSGFASLSSTPTRPTTTTTNNSHRYYLYKEKNRRYSTVNTTLHLFLFYFSLSLSSSFRVLI